MRPSPPLSYAHLELMSTSHDRSEGNINYVSFVKQILNQVRPLSLSLSLLLPSLTPPHPQ